MAAWKELFVDDSNRHAPLKKVRIKGATNPWISVDLRKLMTERDYAKTVAKKSGNQEQWNNYRWLKNLTNRKLKSAEALHYKNLIESAADPKERWRSLNTIIGSNNVRGLSLYLQDGKHLLSKPKEVATKFNRLCDHWR